MYLFIYIHTKAQHLCMYMNLSVSLALPLATAPESRRPSTPNNSFPEIRIESILGSRCLCHNPASARHFGEQCVLLCSLATANCIFGKSFTWQHVEIACFK